MLNIRLQRWRHLNHKEGAPIAGLLGARKGPPLRKHGKDFFSGGDGELVHMEAPNVFGPQRAPRQASASRPGRPRIATLLRLARAPTWSEGTSGGTDRELR